MSLVAFEAGPLEDFSEEAIKPATTLEIWRDSEELNEKYTTGTVAWNNSTNWCKKRLEKARSTESTTEACFSMLLVDLKEFRLSIADSYEATNPLIQLFQGSPSYEDIVRFDAAFGKYPRTVYQQKSHTRSTVETHTYHFAFQRTHLLWAYFPRAQCTVAVVMAYDEITRMVNPVFLDELKALCGLAAQPMFIGICAIKPMALYLEQWHNGEMDGILTAQTTSGFSNQTFDITEESQQPQDHALLSGQVSGNAINYASISYNCQILAAFSDFMVKESLYFLESAFVSNRENWRNDSAYIQEHAAYRSKRFSILAQEADLWQKRAAIQVQGLFNLIAQRDQNLNITIARDTKKIAEESRRDTTSMKAIAAVTMVFLPGTFLASFFAMPLFRWEVGGNNNNVVDQRIWIYWALTGPLTLLTILAWLAWNRLVMKQKRLEDEENANKEDKQEKKPDEEGSEHESEENDEKQEENELGSTTNRRSSNSSNNNNKRTSGRINRATSITSSMKSIPRNSRRSSMMKKSV